MSEVIDTVKTVISAVLANWELCVLLFLSLVTTALVAWGLYTLLSLHFHLPTLHSLAVVRKQAAPEIKISMSDRLSIPIARLLEGHIKLDQYQRDKLKRNLKVAGMNEYSPERYTALSVAFAILVLIPGAVILLAGLYLQFAYFTIMGTALAACSVFIGFYKQREIKKIARRRRGRIDLEIPKMTAAVLQSLSVNGSEDVQKLLREYKPIASPDMAKEIDYILADINTSVMEDRSTESALRRAEVRLNSDTASSFFRGLIGIHKGDNMREYFEGLIVQMNENEISLGERAATRRPNELTIPTWGVLGGMFFMIAVLITETLLLRFG